jgi:hypothetical protein
MPELAPHADEHDDEGPGDPDAPDDGRKPGDRDDVLAFAY